ncbi:hypothetical protein KQI41_01110 [Tissierella pigra]|uniref:hypothetical protein n=1 Tax=Tissierella pigra TaxID=2607614 RepID=UPI001C109684|nr:hypothetical protein [Tissierella pigra]MBU5424994.1 hypothetical protein [Tissierella pigra]
MVNMYSRVEGMLYSHYKRKKRIDSLKSRLIRIENRIERLRRDIKECNIDLEDTMKAIDYSRDSIQNGGVTSNIERELERAVDVIIKEIEYNIRDKYKTKSKITNLEKQIENIELLLEELTEEELTIVELKYGEQLNDREVSERLYMARSTMQRKKGSIIEFIINKCK